MKIFGSILSTVMLLTISNVDAKQKDPSLIEVIKHGTLEDVDKAIKKHKKDPKYINAMGPNSLTPLMHVCVKIPGASKILKLLLDNGADIETGGQYGSEYGSTPLVQAIQDRDIDKVKLLIERGANINVQYGHGTGGVYTPLATALYVGALEIAKLLIKKGADADVVIAWDSTALTIAASKGYADIVSELLEKKLSDINYQGLEVGDSNTALMLAAKNGHYKVVKILLSYNADKTKKNRDQKMAIELAEKELKECTEKYTKIINLLKKDQTDTKKPAGVSDSHETLIDLVKSGDIEKIEEALKQNQDDKSYVNDKNSNGTSALMIACYNGDIKIVQLLLKYGAEINDKASYGETALISALSGYVMSKKDNNKIAKLLIEKGADINAVEYYQTDTAPTPLRNSLVITPLRETIRTGNIEMFKFLLGRGVNVIGDGDRGYELCFPSPLTEAIRSGKKEMVKDIIKALGKDIKTAINTQSQETFEAVSGITALMLAAKQGDNEIVQILLQNGAAPSIKAKNGKTALDFAKTPETIKILKENFKLAVEIKALMLACQNGEHDVVVKILKSFKNKKDQMTALDYRDLENNTPLLWATRANREYLNIVKAICEVYPKTKEGHEELVKIINVRESKDNESALSWAAMQGHSKIVQYILSLLNDDEKVDILNQLDGDEEDHFGRKTVLMSVCSYGVQEPRVVQSIFDSFSNSKDGKTNLLKVINAKDDKGNTALMWAAFYGYEEVVEMLLKNGADTKLINDKGETAIDFAKMKWGKDNEGGQGKIWDKKVKISQMLRETSK